MNAANKELPEEGNPYTFLVKSVSEEEEDSGHYFQMDLAVTGAGDSSKVGKIVRFFLDATLPDKNSQSHIPALRTRRDLVNLIKEETGINIWSGSDLDPTELVGATFRADVAYSIPEDAEKPRLELKRVRA